MEPNYSVGKWAKYPLLYPHNIRQGRSRSLEIGLKVKNLSHFQKENTTSAGFEPARAEPKKFLILRLNHSAKMP